MELPWIITILALATSLVGWLAKLWWSKEYRDAKEAQIASLGTQLDNLRELTPMKLQEYAKATGEMLTKQIDDQQQEIVAKNEQLSALELLTLDLITTGSIQQEEKIDLQEEMESLQLEVAELKEQRNTALEIEEAGRRLRDYLVHPDEENLDPHVRLGAWMNALRDRLYRFELQPRELTSAKGGGLEVADWVYDRHGHPQIIVDGDRFLNRQGNQTIGWTNGTSLYTRSGSHKGWYDDGVLYDGQNRCIGFTAGATGAMPSRPGRSGAPGMPGLAGRPGRPGFSGVPGRPGRGSSWSAIPLADLFS